MILVTGGSGFVGQHLVQALSAAGKKVRALYKSTAPDASLKQLPGIEWQCCDLLDIYDVEEAMVGITQVYHCAAIVSFDPKKKAELLHVNTESTANVVDAALEAGVQKLVHLSSVAALGLNAIEGAEITEAEAWEEDGRSSTYGQSKYQAEMEVWRGAAEGLCMAIVNPGIILGEGNWATGSARLMGIVQEQFPFYTDGLTGWVDVKDVVKAMMLLMQCDIDGERFILSEGNHGFREVFTEMATALGVKPPRIHATGWLTGLVWRISSLKSRLTGKPPTITKETAASAQSRRIYNNSKLLQALPAFTYTPLQETIGRMAAAFRRDLARP